MRADSHRDRLIIHPSLRLVSHTTAPLVWSLAHSAADPKQQR